MTARHLEILQHALGVDKYGQGEQYRNHFCAGGDDEVLCRELIELGYVRVSAPNQSPLPYCNCRVTDAGKAAMLAESPKPPKLTAAQKRYREFLAADTGRSFIEWLKDRKEHAA